MYKLYTKEKSLVLFPPPKKHDNETYQWNFFVEIMKTLIRT